MDFSRDLLDYFGEGKAGNIDRPRANTGCCFELGKWGILLDHLVVLYIVRSRSPSLSRSLSLSHTERDLSSSSIKKMPHLAREKYLHD